MSTKSLNLITIEEVENGFIVETHDQDEDVTRTCVFEDDIENDGIMRLLETIAVTLGCDINNADDDGSIVIISGKELREFKEGKANLVEGKDK